MNVIVVGGGKVGRKLVEDFNYEGDDVVLIDIKSEICDRIQDDYDVRCVCGSGTDLEALREAEANKADIFIDFLSLFNILILSLKIFSH